MGRLAQTEGLTDIQTEILGAVHEFVDKEIVPNAQELEHADEYPAEIVEGMKEMGIFGLMIPEEYGGLGESLLTYALTVEEIARGWMSVSGIINTHFIVAYMLIQHGTEEQKQYFLPKMAAGEVRGSFSMSEPHCGSDVSAIRSKAVRDGDDFVLNGQKMWLTNGGSSTLTAVLVRTEAEAPEDASVYKKMTTFLVEKPAGFGAENTVRGGSFRDPKIRLARRQTLRHLCPFPFGVGTLAGRLFRKLKGRFREFVRRGFIPGDESPATEGHYAKGGQSRRYRTSHVVLLATRLWRIKMPSLLAEEGHADYFTLYLELDPAWESVLSFSRKSFSCRSSSSERSVCFRSTDIHSP